MRDDNHTLRGLIEADNVQLKYQASTNGGEWAGPCPKCGGKDRFRVWPEKGDGHWWCRRCDHRGDAIEYLKWIRGMTFRDACAFLGRGIPKWEPIGKRKPHNFANNRWKSQESIEPVTVWAQQAEKLVEWKETVLWSTEGAEVRTWLRDERGLTDETIRGAHLGLMLQDYFPRREAWGLPEKLKENGKPTKLLVPKGLVIPLISPVGKVLRLRFRRSDPMANSRYYLLPGSSTAPMILGGGTCWVILESELDAILLNQVAGDLVSIVSLGSSSTRPDEAATQKLRAAGKILVALDSDPAGAKDSWTWWLKHFQQAERWPVIEGKDPTEAWKNGLDLRTWVLAGIGRKEDGQFQETGQATELASESEPTRDIEPWEERAAIMEYDGGFSREEAESLAKASFHVQA